MPLYQYRCADGTVFEIIQSIDEEALRVDPESGLACERILFAPVINFKGPGFHNTDYGVSTRGPKPKRKRN